MPCVLLFIKGSKVLVIRFGNAHTTLKKKFHPLPNENLSYALVIKNYTCITQNILLGQETLSGSHRH